MSETLEAYRQQAIDTVHGSAQTLKMLARDTLGMRVIAVYIVGSVTDPKRFTEDSDIDVAVVVESPRWRPGYNHNLTSKFQQELTRNPMGPLGVLNGLVFIDKIELRTGRPRRIDLPLPPG